jgi:hypothetical protein
VVESGLGVKIGYTMVFFAWHASNRMPFLDISGSFPCQSQAASLAEALAEVYGIGLTASSYPFSMIVGYIPIMNHYPLVN